MWNDPSGGISDIITQIRGGAALSRFTRGEILYFPNSDWGIGDRSISRKDRDSVTILVGFRARSEDFVTLGFWT